MGDIWMPNIPSRQYASSSSRVVSRLDAQDILSDTGASSSLNSSSKTSRRMSVTSVITSASSAFVPMTLRNLDRKRTLRGARSSCSVQPRLNHLLLRKLEVGLSARAMLSSSTSSSSA